MHIDGARIVLTGAASGIGRALLAQLADYHAHILAADRDATRLEETVQSLAGKAAQISMLATDLGEREGVDVLFDAAHEALGGIDLFIANAGFAYYETFGGKDDVWAQLDAIYRVNVFSPLYALAKLRALNTNRPYTVVITASAQSKVPVPGYAVYASTKAALDAFANAYRYEQPPNEHLMLVYPVSTMTRFFETASRDHLPPVTPPAQTPEQVAAAVMRGLARDATHVYPSRLFSAAWMLNRLLPVKWLTQQNAARQYRAWRKKGN
jgi:uncharacterized protein